VPIFEFMCEQHGMFEKVMPRTAKLALCERVLTEEIQCGQECPKVEYSVPAKRNPSHGIQR